LNNLKEKIVKDLQSNGQSEMANWLLQNKSPEMNKLIDNVFKDENFFVVCTTCNKVFLNLPFKEFYEKHDFPDPDKWFFEAGIHFAENVNHMIYAYSGKKARYVNSMNISSSLAVGCQRGNVSMAQLKEAYIQELKRVKNKPI
jgi:hypothetical protein